MIDFLLFRYINKFRKFEITHPKGEMFMDL